MTISLLNNKSKPDKTIKFQPSSNGNRRVGESARAIYRNRQIRFKQSTKTLKFLKKISHIKRS